MTLGFTRMHVRSGIHLLAAALFIMLSDPTLKAADLPHPPEPSGASLAFTSDDPVVVRACMLIEQGKLAEAEAMLKQPGAGPARQEAMEIIVRIRAEFNLGAEGLLNRLRGSIPDITADDLSRWTAAGEAQSRVLDGKLFYFNREPSNIFRFYPDAIARRKLPPAVAGEKWRLEDHLAQVIAEAKRTGRRQVLPVRHRVHFTITVPPGAPGFIAGATVRAWLPFPQEYRQQGDVKLISTSPAGAFVAPSASGEYPIEGAPQRTVYFEQKVEDASKPLVFDEVFEYTSSAWYPLLDDALARPLPADWRGGNLNQRPPHILFTPELQKTVAEVVGAETNPLIKARRIFSWVDANIAYNAEVEYSTIRSLSGKALASRRGDCGVQTMLFIAMCRCAGVPARWQSGWETKPLDWNMHDWAEIYVEPWGWLPVDASYGRRKSDDPEVREFYFGHQDSYRLIVNRDYGSPLQPAKQSFRSEPLDFQRGEVEIDGKNLYFTHWKYSVKFEWM
ncbi:MAG TPA: transglutaminase domain-containing protein [Humisphaera sp.]|jgi:transglutaminase-like putative cysteine protease|nr:transglutaminase domain-containing protein [Humisphaera sp.]